MNTYEKIVRLFGENKIERLLIAGVANICGCPSKHKLKENCQNSCTNCWKQAIEEYNPE